MGAMWHDIIADWPIGYRRLEVVLQPTTAELNAMSADLIAYFGGIYRFCASTGFSFQSMFLWRSGANRASTPSRKCLWLLWAIILHPGAIQDLIDIVTYGRCPREVSVDFPLGRANPATAGQLARRWQRSSHWQKMEWVKDSPDGAFGDAAACWRAGWELDYQI